MEEKVTFAEEIKKQLLALAIKPECCKSSFICGAEVFERRRKNAFSDAVAEYVEHLKSKKRRSFFDENAVKGYVKAEKDGFAYPEESGMVCENCLSHLIRGAFLVAGRASKTEKSLNLEMVMPSAETAKAVSELLKGVGLEPKYAERRGESLLYYKKAETVEDFLSFIGAQNASFEIMNDVILKAIRCSANRQKNCDTTNLRKAVEAAAFQLSAINSILENEGSLDGLSAPLRETAKIRLENPIESLEEITDLHVDKISRSGVSHRLSKIVSYAISKGYTDKNSN